MLPEKADYDEQFSIEKLADYDLSGGQIEVVIRNTAYKVALRKEPVFSLDDFAEEIRKEQESTFDREIEMGFRI
jgi:hypothetical protein